jgi:hypothetical protein
MTESPIAHSALKQLDAFSHFQRKRKRRLIDE